MKLNIEQIKNITFGAERILESENGILFRRMTEKTETGFSEYREVFRTRSRVTV